MQRRLHTVINHAAFSYTTIFLLQLKVIWGIWLYRDLTAGDTSSYFTTAWTWFTNWNVLITWSPLYTSFYGTLLHLSTNAFAATILSRVIIVLVSAILVLAWMRRLLPAGIAWAVAAWWALTPINFDSLYEVHQFTVIPVLLTSLAVFWKPGPWGRGLGVAGLLATGVLMRNEFLLAATLFTGVCIGWELWQHRHGVTLSPGTVRAYVVPAIAACALIGFYYSRANDAHAIGPMLQEKHTLNVCQVYAFGYQQRNSDWQGSPWTDCQQLMSRVYGTPQPSLTEALRRNPAAMLAHFQWNLELLPNGLQVLLFNGMSGNVNPDYVAVNRYSEVLPVSLVTLAILLVATYLLWRDRRHWWKLSFGDRVWGWVIMACLACVVPGIVLTQRPRPSYLLVFGIALRAATGMALFILAHRRLRFKPPAILVFLGVVLILALTPTHYPPFPSAGKLIESYRVLAPYHEWIERPGVGLVGNGWAGDLCRYIGHSPECRGLEYATLASQVTPNVPLRQVLERNRASVFFAEESVLADPEARRFVREAAANDWRLIAMRHDKYRNWDLLVKSSGDRPALPGEPAPLDENVRDIVDRSTGVDLGRGWHAFEWSREAAFRWAANDAEINVALPGDGPAVLSLIIADGPSLNGKDLNLQIFGDGKLLQTATVHGRQLLKVGLPGRHMAIRLHTESENKPVPDDSRILNFRVLRIWAG